MMTAYALVSGTLFRVPEQRTSKAGKLYVVATIKAKDGDTFQFWRVTAFSGSGQAELMRLTAASLAIASSGEPTCREDRKISAGRPSL